jgi:hypothetical protein
MGGTGGGGVMVKGAAGEAMSIVYVKVATSGPGAPATGTVLSVTLMMTLAAPVTVGVPLTTPAALRVRPTGGGPDAGSRLQV